MKKRIISIFLIISVITSLFAVTAVSSSAATKPASPVVKIHNGGSANGLYVTWDNISPRATYQIAYRPYGYRAYNYTNTNKTNITLTNLTSGVCYQVQVRACINGVYGGYSKTKSMTFLSRPSLKDSVDSNQCLVLSWNAVRGANVYELVKWNASKKKWVRVFYSSSRTYVDGSARAGEYGRYQVRAMYKTEKNGTAYSAWSPVDYTVYYPKINVKSFTTIVIGSESSRIARGLKKFNYDVSWTLRYPNSNQLYQVRFAENPNSTKDVVTIKVKGRKCTFKSDNAYKYVCVRYLNEFGQPVGPVEWNPLEEGKVIW